MLPSVSTEQGRPQFRILGPLEVVVSGRPKPLRGAKQRALLAILLLHANEVVSTDLLIDGLWGDSPPDSASKALQMHVSKVRRTLGLEAALVTHSAGYRLQIEPEQLDALTFEYLTAEARRAFESGDLGLAVATLRESLALWRGPALADFAYAAFAQHAISELEESRTVALEQRIDYELALGDGAGLVGELEALVKTQPLRERFHAQLMLALYRAGRQAEALEVYTHIRQTLVEELGIEPGRKLRELQQAILRQEPALDPKAAADIGGHRATAGAFVGRQRELAELLAGLDDVCAGRGRLFLLSGEPGIGKSRLAEELISHSKARGARVLVGRCWEAGGAPAYWPWVQSLRGYVRDCDPGSLRALLGRGAVDIAQILPELRERFPDLPELLDVESEGARFRLFDGVTTFLSEAARVRPLVVALDDLHVADEPSLLLLQFLAREMADSRLLVVAAYRDVDPTVRDSLARVAAELTREPVTRTISLVGLDASEAAQFIEQATGHEPVEALSASVYAKTEGNPLFMGEIVRLLAAEGHLDDAVSGRLGMPPTVKDVIGRRLRRLSQDCARVLTVASVLGREFGLDALARLVESPPSDLLSRLDEAIEERVLNEIPASLGQLRFSHGLVRDAIYESIAPGQRMQLHRRVGEALEQLYASDPDAHLAELAHHFLLAAPVSGPERAIDYSVRAGNRAASLLAYEEAVRHYELALDLVDDPASRCELLLAIGGAQARAGDTPTAKQTFREAARIAQTIGLPAQLARAALGYGGRIIWEVSRDDPYLVPLLEAALDAIDDDHQALRVRLLARLAGGPLRDASHPQARRAALSAEALETARRLGDPATLAYALSGYIAGNHSPRFTEMQVELASELIEVATEAGDKERAVEGHEHRLAAFIELGKMPEAKADLTAMSKLADELRQPSQDWYVAQARAMIALIEGRLDDAERLIVEARDRGEHAQRWNALVTFRLQLYVLRWTQGRLQEVEQMVDSSVEEYPTYPIWRCVLAHMTAHLAQELSEGATLGPPGDDDMAALPIDEEWIVSMCFLADAAKQREDARSAAMLYEPLLPYARRVAMGTPEICIGAVSHYLGVLATTMSEFDAAERHFEAAISINGRIDARPWLAHTRREYGGMLLRRSADRDQKRACELLARASAEYRELRIDTWLRSASALLEAVPGSG